MGCSCGASPLVAKGVEPHQIDGGEGRKLKVKGWKWRWRWRFRFAVTDVDLAEKKKPPLIDSPRGEECTTHAYPTTMPRPCVSRCIIELACQGFWVGCAASPFKLLCSAKLVTAHPLVEECECPLLVVCVGRLCGICLNVCVLGTW